MHTHACYFEASSGWGQVISSWLFCGGRSQVISGRSCITDRIEKQERQVQGLCHWRSLCLFCVGVTVGIALMVTVSKAVVPVKTSSLNSFCVCHSVCVCVRACMCVKRNCFLIVFIKYPSCMNGMRTILISFQWWSGAKCWIMWQGWRYISTGHFSQKKSSTFLVKKTPGNGTTL